MSQTIYFRCHCLVFINCVIEVSDVSRNNRIRMPSRRRLSIDRAGDFLVRTHSRGPVVINLVSRRAKNFRQQQVFRRKRSCFPLTVWPLVRAAGERFRKNIARRVHQPPGGKLGEQAMNGEFARGVTVVAGTLWGDGEFSRL